MEKGKPFEDRALEYGRADVQRAIGDVAASTGSVCHPGATSLSPVLAAMGVSADGAAATNRFRLIEKVIVCIYSSSIIKVMERSEEK